jgi:hypothetical protein
MDRLLLTLAIVVFFALCVWGMRRGWLRKARSQSVLVPPFPEVPEAPGEPVLPETTGLYVSTTIAGEWQNRIVTRGAGLRSAATLRLYRGGIEVDRAGAPGFWIPAESLSAVRRDNHIAGKVLGVEGLLVVTWKAGETLLDTGFRGDDVDVYPQWIEALEALIPVSSEKNQDNGKAQKNHHTSEIKGGAQ